MSYAAYESSIESGRPIHLYRFTLGSTVWRYTSADEDLTIGGFLWKASPITDEGVRQTGEAASDTMTIDAPSNIGPAQVYMSGAPSRPIVVNRLSLHEGITVPVVNYVGEVFQANFHRPGAVKFSAQTISATLRRNGLRLGWQRSCPYALYDPVTCQVDRSQHATSVTLTSVSGFTATGAGFGTHPDGYFSGGLLEWAHPVMGAMFLTVDTHIGTSIEVFGETNDLYPGLVLTAYPGCARTLAACNSFGNLGNYGGCPSMPGKSPYDGTPVF